jgi:hypothetical protein
MCFLEQKVEKRTLHSEMSLINRFFEQIIHIKWLLSFSHEIINTKFSQMTSNFHGSIILTYPYWQ